MSRVTSANPNNQQGTGGLSIGSGSLGANVTTTSTTAGGVSTGFGVTVTALSTGRFIIFASLSADHSVADDTVSLYIYRVAGSTIPANAAAVTGTGIAAGQTVSPANAGTCTIPLVITDTPGLGTTSYYIAYNVVQAGTATLRAAVSTIAATTITVIEI